MEIQVDQKRLDKQLKIWLAEEDRRIVGEFAQRNNSSIGSVLRGFIRSLDKQNPSKAA